MLKYDNQNVFAKILRGEIPCKKVYEDQYSLAFEDINPQAPVHVLVIPKGQYVCFTDFSLSASSEEIVSLTRVIKKVVNIKSIEESGYRLVVNNGNHGMQEVPHLHFHIFGGTVLGQMLPNKF